MMIKPHGASKVGADTPKNEEACSTPHAAGLGDQEIKEQVKYQASAQVDATPTQQNPTPDRDSHSDADVKKLTGRQAWAALRGYSVERIRGVDGVEGLTASKSGATCQFGNQEELTAFIEHTGREDQANVLGSQLRPDLVELGRPEWEEFRRHCFIRCSLEPVWIWAAAHDFEFCHIGLFLADVDGAKIDLGSNAMSIHAFDHWHVIPLVRMTVKSLEHLASVSNFLPVQRRADLLNAQAVAERTLRDLVDQRFLFKAAPGSSNGTIQ